MGHVCCGWWLCGKICRGFVWESHINVFFFAKRQNEKQIGTEKEKKRKMISKIEEIFFIFIFPPSFLHVQKQKKKSELTTKKKKKKQNKTKKKQKTKNKKKKNKKQQSPQSH